MFHPASRTKAKRLTNAHLLYIISIIQQWCRCVATIKRILTPSNAPYARIPSFLRCRFHHASYDIPKDVRFLFASSAACKVSRRSKGAKRFRLTVRLNHWLRSNHDTGVKSSPSPSSHPFNRAEFARPMLHHFGGFDRVPLDQKTISHSHQTSLRVTDSVANPGAHSQPSHRRTLLGPDDQNMPSLKISQQ